MAWPRSTKPQPAPSVILSHVCRAWRTLALDSPLLWTKIEAVVPRHSYYAFPRLKKGLHLCSNPEQSQILIEEENAKWTTDMELVIDSTQEWIRRSRDAPLSVQFILSNITRPGPLTKDYIEKLVDILLGVAHRWEEMDFITGFRDLEPYRFLFSRILAIAPLRLPILRKLRAGFQVDLRTANSVSLDAAVKLLQNLGFTLFETPSLRFLSVTPTWPNFVLASTPILTVPWSELTTIHLGHKPETGTGSDPHAVFSRLDTRCLLEVLRPCMSLSSLFFHHRPRRREPEPWEEEPLTSEKVLFLPSLRSLTLSGSPSPTNLSSYLDAPNLRELKLLQKPTGLSRETFFGQKQRIKAWIEAYGAQIISIELGQCSVLSKAEFVECLGRLPVVEELKIHGESKRNFRPSIILEPLFEDGVEHEPGEVDDEVLQLLTPEDGGDACLLPRLRSLDVVYQDGYPFKEESLVRFVEARRVTAHNRIERVSMYDPYNRNVPAGAREELARRGVDLMDFTLHLTTDDEYDD